MAAILDAAGELLVERSPREVTVRDVAERARVNHALVHRHFGTKDDLLRAVLVRRSEAFGRAAAEVGVDAESILPLLTQHADYWRILARFVLDAPNLLTADLPAGSMVLARIGADASGGDRTAADAAVAAAVAGSLALGWAVFGAHLDEVLGHPDQQRVGELLARTVRGVLAAPVAASRVSRAGSSAAAGSASRGSSSRSTGSPRSSRSGR
jgi:AcrR family transcriptional regulator